MEVLVPTGLAAVHEALGALPEARLLGGGTDLLVELRAADRQLPAVIHLGAVPELQGWRRTDGLVELGAVVTLAELAGAELAAVLPALAAAAAAVACPQVRNAATLGGNLATAAPTSDLIPVLAALGATALVEGPGSRREVPIGSLPVAPRPGDVLVAVRVPLRRGPEVYLRAGTRRGMALPMAAVAVAVDLDARSVRCAVGAGGPPGLRAVEAERWVAAQVEWAIGRVPDPRTYETFGWLVADAARPAGDGRASAAYRRHAVGVLARRALMRAM